MLRYPIVIYHHASAIAMYPTLLCAYAISPCCMTFHLSAVHRVTSIYPKHIVARYFTPLYCIFFFFFPYCFLCYLILFYRILHYVFIPSLPLYFTTALLTRVCGLRLCMNVTVARACLPAGTGAATIHYPRFLSFSPSQQPWQHPIIRTIALQLALSKISIIAKSILLKLHLLSRYTEP